MNTPSDIAQRVIAAYLAPYQAILLSQADFRNIVAQTQLVPAKTDNDASRIQLHILNEIIIRLFDTMHISSPTEKQLKLRAKQIAQELPSASRERRPLPKGASGYPPPLSDFERLKIEAVRVSFRRDTLELRHRLKRVASGRPLLDSDRKPGQGRPANGWQFTAIVYLAGFYEFIFDKRAASTIGNRPGPTIRFIRACFAVMAAKCASAKFSSPQAADLAKSRWPRDMNAETIQRALKQIQSDRRCDGSVPEYDGRRARDGFSDPSMFECFNYARARFNKIKG